PRHVHGRDVRPGAEAAGRPARRLRARATRRLARTPRIGLAAMRVQTLLYFYGRRLRTHPIQELLAGLGIAIGVALAFAVLVANGSIVGSAETIMRAVVGRADLQLQARSADGFDARVLAEVERVRGVRQAAPLLEQRATLRGPNGREVAVNLGSLDRKLAALSGRLAGNYVSGGFRLLRGVLLP